MGKAADNERKKLLATWYNNLSIGVLLGGLLIPYLSFVTKAYYVVSTLTSGKSFTFEEQAYCVGVIASMAFAFYGAMKLRRWADKVASQIEGN